jgi:hypothetical protein
MHMGISHHLNFCWHKAALLDYGTLLAQNTYSSLPEFHELKRYRIVNECGILCCILPLPSVIIMKTTEAYI